MVLAITRRKRRKVSSTGDELEKTIQSSIISFLKKGQLIHNRVNNGQFEMASEHRKRRVRCNSLEGISDIEIYTYMENEDGTKIQVMIYLEVKTKTGKQSETQVDFDNIIDSIGGLYFIVKSVEDTYLSLLKAADYISRSVSGYKLYIGRAKI